MWRDRRDVVAAIAGEGYHEPDAGKTLRVREVSSRPKVMELRGITSAALEDVSFDIRAGEILGIYGLSGSGRTETLRAIAGLDSYDGGAITIAGERYEPKNPRHAKQHGIAFVTEERKFDGILPEMNSYQNASLPSWNSIRALKILVCRSLRFRRLVKTKRSCERAQSRSLNWGHT